MRGYEIPKIIITVALTIVEGIVGFILYRNNLLDLGNWWFFFISYIAPVGFLYFVNFYILSPIIINISLVAWEKTGHYKIVSNKFKGYSEQCISWLNSTPKHWGEVNIDKECQNANTCEGLLAIKKTGLDAKHNVAYLDALNVLLLGITDKGLTSKSLQRETVVCTSMALYLYSLELKTNNDMQQFKSKFDNVAKNLWEAHCDAGWGVYVLKPNQEDCSTANTFWALRALNEYYPTKSPEYRKMVRRIYEMSNNSLFGYNSADDPRLCTTAMSVVLYYSLDNEDKEIINNVYDINKAVNFVYEMFCIKKIECELEIINGLKSKTVATKKGPWTHITIAFVAEALVNAYKNGNLNRMKMNGFIVRIKKICKQRLIYLNGNNTQCYYMPRGMTPKNEGIFTFPTSYMAWALGTFDFE